MIILYSLLLWIFFIAFANIKKYTTKEYNPIIQAFALLFSFIFGVGDVLYNVTAGSLLFLQFPHYKRLTLTARLKYILQTGSGWRYKLSDFLCRRMIEPWDYNHCGLKTRDEGKR